MTVTIACLGGHLVATLFRLCVLRANPQDLPASYALLAITLTAYAAAEILGLVDALPLRSVFHAVAIDVVLLVVITVIALRLRGLSARLAQTLSALSGAGAVLTLAVYVLHNVTAPWSAPAYLGPLFVGWWLVVYTHVLRHSLALHVGAAAAVSAIYLLASVGVSLAYLGPSEPVPVSGQRAISADPRVVALLGNAVMMLPHDRKQKLG